MTYDELQKKTAELYASGEVYTSPDFQCDQTGGFPTSLCVCWEKQKAWLELNENLLMDRDDMELGYYRDLCADYGIRSCCDIEDFNHLLRGLGEDAVRTAELFPDEDESIEKHNMPQKGIVNISKSGEVFFSAVESDGVYSFVFADKGLAGAVYEITAAEDIITPDGTLRYAKGAVVDTVTTDENGNAASKPLYLGKYTVRETKAPYGMVLNDEAKSVELTYAGETVKLTETSAEFYNERQKAEVSLSKILGKDETFGIGNNGEILSVQFGLYAAEDLTAADGSVIPKDGLLEVANCNENGNITFKTDIPVGAKLYVKEIATDSHYILSDEKYPVTFDYAGQDTALVEIKANGGEAIKNDILYSVGFVFVHLKKDLVELFLLFLGFGREELIAGKRNIFLSAVLLTV